MGVVIELNVVVESSEARDFTFNSGYVINRNYLSLLLGEFFMSFDPSAYALELQAKFEFYFLSLTFGGLALSLQFSPKFGHSWPYLLVMAWLLLFLSGLIGGWLAMQKPVALQFLARSEQMKQYLRSMEERGQIQLLDEDSGRPLDFNKNKKQYQEAQRSSQDSLEILNKKFEILGALQMYLFISGFLCNLIFTIKNYLTET